VNNLEELKAGIKTFWLSLTPVIPKVLQAEGAPSGY